MATIFIPVHTSCSTDGMVSGDRDLGVCFSTRTEAEDYLRANPNPLKGWGESEAVREVDWRQPIHKVGISLERATAREIEYELQTRGLGYILRPDNERCG